MEFQREEIVGRATLLLDSLNYSEGYDSDNLRKLFILVKRIKQFAIKNTAIDKNIMKIYRKFSPGIYFVTVFAETNNFQKSLDAYKLAELWGGYIQYEDLFYECGNQAFRKLAYKFRDRAVRKLTPDTKRKMVEAERLLQKYWKYELKYKEFLKSGYKFTDKDIEDFLLLKAQSIQCYAVLLRQFCRITQKHVDFMNYNQAIYNFYDDYWDLKEDLEDHAPNTFVIALLADGAMSFDDLKKYTRKEVVAMIKTSGAWRRLQKIAERIKGKAEKMPLPKRQKFWHFMPRYNYEFFEVYFEES